MTRRERRVRRGITICAALTVAALLTACAGAQAKTVKLGSPLHASFEPWDFAAGGYCGGAGPEFPCDLSPSTWVQTTLTLPQPTNVQSPSDGTVISYRVAAADGTFAIQVIRIFPSSGQGQSVASSTGTSITDPGVSPPIATNLAIGKGDYVGIRNFFQSGSDGDFDQLGWDLVSGGGTVRWWYPPLEDGAPSRSGVGWGPFIEGEHTPAIGMQATVRYCKVPDLGGKSPKAARKTLTAADCRVGKLKKTKKMRDRKEVVSQSVKPGRAVSDRKPIKLGLSRKG